MPIFRFSSLKARQSGGGILKSKQARVEGNQYVMNGNSRIFHSRCARNGDTTGIAIVRNRKNYILIR